MYLIFNTELECKNAIIEISKRMGLTGNLTSTFSSPRETVNGTFAVKMPKRKYMDEIKKCVRPITITNDEGAFKSIEIVKKQYDEKGIDKTVYDKTEYELTTQKALSDLFSYKIYEMVQFPTVKEE